MSRVAKAVAYVVRDGLLLVFEHEAYPAGRFPEVGIQVPAGTLRDGEDSDAAALREAEEETGYAGFRIVRKLGTAAYFHAQRGEWHDRHVYLLAPPAGLPAAWRHLAEEGDGDFVFVFRWIPLAGAERVLAGEQGALLGRLEG